MILNRAERMLARRYLLPGKGEGFIFLVASISLVAVALGVAALIIVMSVMNGFRAELFDKIVGLNGHAVVQGYDGRLSNWEQIADQARKTPGVTSALPLIEQPLMASANGRVEGVLVRGMRMPDILANKTITSNVVAGDLRSIAPGTNRVAIGSRLAEALGAYPGSEISLISPEGRSTVVGTVPRIVSYTVGAIFEVGIYDYDKAFVLMPMPEAQDLLMLGDQVGIVEIQTSNPDKVEQIVAPIQQTVRGHGIIVDWRQMNSALFQALEVERVAMFVVLSLIVLVAVFNILSSLIMLVRAKTRDIAILRTMGATRGTIMRVFFITGAAIGTVGTLAGLVLGVIICLNVESIRQFVSWLTSTDVFSPELYFLSQLPADMNLGETVSVIIMALALSYLATIYPAWRAARLDPVDALRYE